MFRKKQGFPEESELLLCTVTKIYPHSVFVNIDEYDRSGMIHISEIAPGRIRNISEYVKEGKKIVCKVLKVDLERGHIDLSLRRVGEGQRRQKMDEIKQEQKVEKIIEMAAKNLKCKPVELYDKLAPAVFNKYQSMHACFEDFISNEGALKDAGLDPKSYKELTDLIRQRIKPQQVIISGDVTLRTYAPDGVDQIKRTLMTAEKLVPNASIMYKGGGKYQITVIDGNFKDAERKIKTVADSILEQMKKAGAEVSFVKHEGKVAET
ncbi:translation initiation factor IF-2 subunit alpha [Candidatus Woesearchaeota archaeon]|nr:translation initiation factor IF-2 subunit alpha [Candidatus Woesearchaeota archaeon]